jgi:hypothetical protein
VVFCLICIGQGRRACLPALPCLVLAHRSFPATSAAACPQAVEFVQLQRDDDLWEQLISLTLRDVQLTGGCPCPSMVPCRWRVAGWQAPNSPPD